MGKSRVWMEIQRFTGKTEELVIHVPIRVARDMVVERKADRPPLPDMTPCEKKVFDLIIQGKVHKEIAALLNIETRTVKFHCSSLLRKLRLDNKGDILRLYGVISIDDYNQKASAQEPEPVAEAVEAVAPKI